MKTKFTITVYADHDVSVGDFTITSPPYLISRVEKVASSTLALGGVDAVLCDVAHKPPGTIETDFKYGQEATKQRDHWRAEAEGWKAAADRWREAAEQWKKCAQSTQRHIEGDLFID
jgi:hypothetical protein